MPGALLDIVLGTTASTFWAPLYMQSSVSDCGNVWRMDGTLLRLSDDDVVHEVVDEGSNLRLFHAYRQTNLD